MDLGQLEEEQTENELRRHEGERNVKVLVG